MQFKLACVYVTLLGPQNLETPKRDIIDLATDGMYPMPHCQL